MVTQQTPLQALNRGHLEAAALRLRAEDFLAHGEWRLVFCHTHDPSRLLKLICPDRMSLGVKWRRAGHFQPFDKEMSEYLVLRARDPNAEPFVAPIYGLVETNLVLAPEVARIRGLVGKLVPTLDDLIRDGIITEQLRAGLTKLATRLVALHIIVSAFKAHNFMLLPNGQDFCVLDGLGVKTVLSLRKHSQLVWRLTMAQALEKLHARIAAGRFKRACLKTRLLVGVKLSDTKRALR